MGEEDPKLKLRLGGAPYSLVFDFGRSPPSSPRGGVAMALIVMVIMVMIMT